MAKTRSTSSSSQRRDKRSGSSGGEKKPRWYKQIWDVYKVTHEVFPLIWLWLAGAMVLFIAIGLGLGLFAWKGHAVYMTVLGLMVGLVADMFLLMNRGEKAAYRRIEDQPGAATAAIGQIRRGWSFESEPVAADQRTRSFIFRGVGRPGIVLVTDGPEGARLNKLITDERRKVSRVAPEIPITVLHCGKGEGQIKLEKLSRHIKHLPRKISKAELGVVENRMKSLGA
ncbi:MAG: DUF4191 domain-containing protein, partial [Bifidobacteriaceae bacterium]|nr:DUF4191 domain-containing protein [Bifidobacteriaceae bacterium]